jgi:hypothetical protein
VARGAKWRHEVGEGLGLTGRRWAVGTSPAVARSGALSALRQRRAGVADGWPPRYSGGRRGREPDADAWAPQHNTEKEISNPVKIKRFKWFQIPSHFDCLKQDLSGLQKFETKYGFEDLGEMNNFLHNNFSRFGMVRE